MSLPDRMTQVLLERPSDSGHFQDVFWIDAKMAKAGRRVMDTDDLVWVVREVYGSKERGQFHDSGWRQFRDVLD